MAKQKKYLLDFDVESDYDLIGICSHHNDYRLAWAINSSLELHLEQSNEPFVTTNTKKKKSQSHPMFEFYEDENRITYYLIKNKEGVNYLIPEKPSIDFFLFVHKSNVIDIVELTNNLKKVNSILAVFILEPELLPSTENIIF